MARKAKDLVFVALGGVGEIGMNLYAYGYGPEDNRQWLVVDIGVVFGNGYPPAVDILLPDISYLETIKDNIQAIVITHAHEDHLGGLPWLWEKLGVPIYASKFTSELAIAKLKEVQLEQQVQMHLMEHNKPFTLGAFEITPLLTAHSTAEPYHLLIDTPAGKVFHSGDWKFDAKPILHKPTTKEHLKSLGDEGVLALVCDSTNVLEDGRAGNEGDIRKTFDKLFAEAKQSIYITCFASNVARMQMVAEAAKKVGRVVIAEGSSIKRMEKVARECGYLAKVPAFLSPSDADNYSDTERVILCTGSQGEGRAALSRLVFGRDQKLQPQKGDLVIFSSKIIPGNEVSVYRIQNQLAKLGVDLITDDDALVHVSGHPNKDEVLELYKLLRPRFSLPVHGEYRMLKAHKEMALNEAGCAQALIAEDGALVRIASGGMEVIDEVYNGRLAIDGDRVYRLDSSMVRGRTKALFDGFMVVSVIMDVDGNLFELPKISSTGIMEDEEVVEIRSDIATILDRELDRVNDDIWEDDHKLAEALRIVVRRYISRKYNKRSIINIHLTRLEN
ncbi:MAG: ribonuclease J [Alphaproteobacteria bacterium]